MSRFDGFAQFGLAFNIGPAFSIHQSATISLDREWRPLFRAQPVLVAPRPNATQRPGGGSEVYPIIGTNAAASPPDRSRGLRRGIFFAAERCRMNTKVRCSRASRPGI